MKEIVRQVMKIRVWALFALAAFACAGSAWAESDCVVTWKTVSPALRDGYLKDTPVSGKYTESKLVDHTVYLMTARNGSGYYGDSTSGAKGLFAALKNGTMTVADVKASAFIVAQTGDDGMIAETSATIHLTANTNFYMCSFSDNERYIYFGSANNAGGASVTSKSLSWSFDNRYWNGVGPAGGSGESVQQGDQSGWYKMPPATYLTVTVEPVKDDECLTAAIGGTESMNHLSEAGNFLVETNKTFDIVYTTKPGWLFADGSNRKARTFASDVARVKDDAQFQFIADPSYDSKTQRYVKWSATTGELAEPTEFLKRLIGHPVHLMAYTSASDLYARMENGAVTVYDMEGLAEETAFTTRDGRVNELKVPLGNTGTSTNVYMVAVSPDKRYVYFSSTKAVQPTTAGASVSWQFYTTMKETAKPTTSTYGWYKAPQRAYLTMTVKPCMRRQTMAEIIGTERLPLSDGNFLVETNETYEIVYTIRPGWEFVDGATAKTNGPYHAVQNPFEDPNVHETRRVKAAKIGDTEYDTFDEALAAVQTDETIELYDDAVFAPVAMPGRFKVQANGYRFDYVRTFEGVRTDWDGANGVWEIEGGYFEVMDLEGLGVVTTNKFTYLTNVLARAEGEFTDALAQTAGNYSDMTNLFLLRDVTLAANAVVGRSVWYTGDTNILKAVGFTFENGATLTVKGGLIDFPYQANIVLEGGRFYSGYASYKDTTTGWANKYKPSGYAYLTLNPAVRTYDKQFIKTLASGQAIYPFVDSKGRAVTAVLNSAWATNSKIGGGTASTRSERFGTVQANGLTFLENAVLGITSNWTDSVSKDAKPFVSPVQTADADKISLRLGNSVARDSTKNPVTTVKYRVFASDKPGGKDGGASEEVTYTGKETIEMPLPDNGVKYYMLGVELDTVQ